jgi:type IV pilus modification protein PilV
MTKQHNGIGLIEVLIALFIVAIGILSLTQMYGSFMQSTADNKARSEAIAIAQSRLENMRNYMHAVSTRDEFNTLYADGSNSNSATINGINTVFTRQETIASAGEMKNISVSVLWSDPTGTAQSVSLDTELTYTPPGVSGLLGLAPLAPLIDSPTGRARLGDGTLPPGATTSENGDGTKYYADGPDLKLAVDNQIVLTLDKACRIDGTNCTDFVKIKGRIYIDEASTNVSPGGVYVLASDASFCTRYYIDDNGTTQAVTPTTTQVAQTANGDYSYYDYTCYLGGGWHGNVGILLDGGVQQSDKICMGDPTAADAWDAPVIALRRAYRGMVYELDGNGSPVTNNSGDIIYYSHGIGDAVELPDPNTTDHGHDFVVSRMSPNDLDGSNCISVGVMVRDDANINGEAGDRFAGNPGDFFCLNAPDASYLDNYDSSSHGAGTSCPYDPTDPPIERHEISGTIRALGVTPDDDATAAAMVANTSDGAGNCLVGNYVHDGSAYVANYACDVHDWGSGWTGTVRVDDGAALSRLSCSPSTVSKSGLTADSSGNDFNCLIGNRVRIAGSVTTPNANKNLDSVEMSGGSCTLANDGLSYVCISDIYEGDSWNGSLSFASPAYLCAVTATTEAGSLVLGGGDNTATAIASALTGSNSLPIQVANNAMGCP